MKKRYLFISLSISMVATLILSSISLASNPSSSVTIMEAERAALNHIELVGQQMDGWSTAMLSAPVTYYTPDGTKSAYEYTVLNSGKEVGYIFVSARNDWMPVLEYGGGKAPSNYLPVAHEIAEKKGYAVKGSKSRLLYWGGLTYSVQYEGNMKDNNIAVHLPTGVIRNVPEEKLKLKMDEGKAREIWAEILGQDTSSTFGRIMKSLFGARSARAAVEIPISSRFSDVKFASVEIDGVTPFYQDNYSGGHGDEGNDNQASWPSCNGTANDPWDHWDGCACVAGAMVLGYWEGNGYSSLPSNDDTLVDYCHHYMGTTDSGTTTTSNVDDGIDDILAIWDYDDDFDVSNDTFVSWNDIKNQVDNDFPSLLHIWGGTSDFDHHSVTVVGYYESFENFIWLYNGWELPMDYIVYNNWDDATLTKVEED